MSLKEILKQIGVNEPLANETVENEPRSTYAGRFGRKARAVESLKELKIQYRKELLGNAMFMVVVGDGRDYFVKVGTSEPNSLFSANPKELYQDLAGRISPKLYTGNSTVGDLLDAFSRHLEEKAMELGISEYPQTVFKQELRRPIASKEDVVQLIQDVINSQVGAELAGIQAVYSITNEAISKKHIATSTPIILATDDDTLAQDLIRDLPRLTPNVFLVLAGETSKALKLDKKSVRVKEVTEESVTKALSTIKKMMKKD